MTIDLNCDMGEMADSSVDQFLMPFVTSANVACGGHAGDDASMERTVRMAMAAGVAVGAHPGYPDRENFGRIEMTLTAEEIGRTVEEQVTALDRVARRLGAVVAHVKPHGALYNVAARNEGVARAIAAGVARWNPAAVLVGLAGSVMLEAWRESGFRVAAEGFADRRYEADGSLRSRKFPDALITDAAHAAEQALELAGRVQTICVHSDTPDSTRIVQAVRDGLRRAGISLRPVAL